MQCSEFTHVRSDAELAGDLTSRVTEAQGEVEVLWSSSPKAIHPTQVSLSVNGGSVDVPASQIFVFIGGELPTRFLRDCGVEIETHFGAP